MTKKVTQLQVGAKTDTGRKRDHNEDQFALVEQYKEKAAWPLAEKKGNLFIVADGMGGHNAGEVASRLAVEIIARQYYGDDSLDIETSLRQAIEEANRQVHQRAQEVRAEAGMGSTIVAAVIRGDEIFVAHAGDSRAYRIRQGQIEPLTQDHSWVSEQLARNLITPEQARTHPYRNYITRSLGIKPGLEVDTNHWAIRQGDVYLLCSDGLSGLVQDETMRDVVSQWEPADACEDLVRRANEAGGPDNITAVVIRVDRVVPTPAAFRAGAPAPAPETVLGPERPKTTELLPATRARAVDRASRTMPMVAGIAFAVVAVLALAAAAFFYLQNQALEGRAQAAEATLTAVLSVADQSTELAEPTNPPTETPSPTSATEPPTEGPAPTSKPSDTPTNTPSPTASSTPSPSPTDTPPPSPPTEAVSLPFLAAVADSADLGLWVREEPREDATKVRLLDKGTGLLVWGRNPEGTWLSVTTPEDSPYGALRGWVFARWVAIDMLINDLPVGPAPTFTPSPTPTDTATSTPTNTPSPEPTGA